MIQRGKVITVDGDTATVEIIRESACSGCHNRESCGAGAVISCTKAEKVVITANNLCDAKPGDSVELTSDNLRSIAIAFSVFVLPILIGFGAYCVSRLFLSTEMMAYIVAGVLFAASFFGFFFGMDRHLAKKINVDITRVITDTSV